MVDTGDGAPGSARVRLRPFPGRRFATALAKAVAVVVIVSAATLLLLDLLPGGPAEAILGAEATPEQIAALEAELGLNDPFPVRLWEWISDLARGDLGRSTRTNQPVGDMIKERIPVTLELALGAMATALVLAVPAGVYAAYRRDKLFDRCAMGFSSLLLSVPSFLLAVVLVLLLAVQRHTFPVSSWRPISEGLGANLRHACLPVMSLALGEAAVAMRLLRNDMVATLDEDFVLAARARGLPTRTVLFRHALRPSSFSLVTVAGVSLGRLIGGTVIIETLFALPGLGRMAIESINSRDYVVVRGIVILAAISYIVLNTLVDAIYPLLDPRVGRRS